MSNPIPRPCAHCGDVFTPKTHAYARCCSGKCSRLAWFYRHRRVVPFVPRACPTCTRSLSEDSHPNKIYCSVVCRDVARRVNEHGITLTEYTALLETQGHRCAICRCDESPNWDGLRRDGWHIDHDHVTGKVRGVLCPRCNMLLGHALDNPAVLAAAIDYLNR